jgi:DNA-binding protein HU-beta
MTIGMNEKRSGWLCCVFNRVTHPRSSCALSFLSLHKGIHHGQDDQELVDRCNCRGNADSKGDAKAVTEQMATVGYKELNESGEFVIPGFAKMLVVNKPATEARSGANPFTKEPMEFVAKPASKSVKAYPEGCQRRCLKRTGGLRRVRSSELWVIPSHPRHAPPPVHYAPRDEISGGPGGQSRKGHAV